MRKQEENHILKQMKKARTKKMDVYLLLPLCFYVWYYAHLF